MTIEIATFEWVPPFAQGWVKDIRPRWALAEAGLDYKIRLISGANDENNGPEYRAWQPFGQVPAYRDAEVQLFETGAILLHIANRSETLKPRDAQDAANIQSWCFAALNSVEPRVDNLIQPATFHAGEAWLDGFRPHAEKLVDLRLKSLTGHLKDRDWLTDRFSVADILMATVLRGLQEEPILAQYPIVAAYLDRALARPAFQTALQGQLETFRANAPKVPA